MGDQNNSFLFLCHLQDEFYANFHFCMYTYSYYNDVILTRIHENTGSVKCAGDFFFVLWYNLQCVIYSAI